MYWGSKTSAENFQRQIIWVQTLLFNWLFSLPITSKWHLYQPSHDKPNKMTVRLAKTQISLGNTEVFGPPQKYETVRSTKMWMEPPQKYMYETVTDMCRYILIGSVCSSFRLSVSNKVVIERKRVHYVSKININFHTIGLRKSHCRKQVALSALTCRFPPFESWQISCGLLLDVPWFFVRHC